MPGSMPPARAVMAPARRRRREGLLVVFGSGTALAAPPATAANCQSRMMMGHLTHISREWSPRDTMIDEDGFRPNVGIIVHNDAGRVLWARRVGQDAWQFPQGGIKAYESPVDALYRELREELGLSPDHVELVGQTRDWLRYRLPRRYVRRRPGVVCIGQKQRWFLLRLLGDEDDVQVDAGAQPEFDHWKWVNYWHPTREVVFFKRGVYRRALKELAPLLYRGLACG